jgi:hypothetical protein
MEGDKRLIQTRTQCIDHVTGPVTLPDEQHTDAGSRDEIPIVGEAERATTAAVGARKSAALGRRAPAFMRIGNYPRTFTPLAESGVYGRPIRSGNTADRAAIRTNTFGHIRMTTRGLYASHRLTRTDPDDRFRLNQAARWDFTDACATSALSAHGWIFPSVALTLAPSGFTEGWSALLARVPFGIECTPLRNREAEHASQHPVN